MGAFSDEPQLINPQVYAQYVFVNVVAAVMTAASHNSLYFLMGFSNWMFHFLHYTFAFVALLIAAALKISTIKRISLRQIWPISVSQFFVTAAASIVHSGGKDGALYTLRVTDFAVTLLVMFLVPKIIDEQFGTKPEYKPLVITIAVSSSMAWLEPEFMEKSWFALAALPVLIIASASHHLITFRTQLKLGVTADQLMLYHTGLTALLLLPTALLFTSDSFNKEILNNVSSWEIADYGIISMSVCCMAGLMYSKYWLMGYCSPEAYNVIRHGRYTLASFGQWITQNMAWVTIFSASGKAISVVAVAAYFYRRYKRDVRLTSGIPARSNTKDYNGYDVDHL